MFLRRLRAFHRLLSLHWDEALQVSIYGSSHEMATVLRLRQMLRNPLFTDEEVFVAIDRVLDDVRKSAPALKMLRVSLDYYADMRPGLKILVLIIPEFRDALDKISRPPLIPEA